MNVREAEEMIRAGDVHRFYNSRTWKRIRREVLTTDRHECQDCKAVGRYSRAVQVHHEKRLEKHPELALEKHFMDGTGLHRQLVSLCEACHMKRHDYQHRPKGSDLTNERWD